MERLNKPLRLQRLFEMLSTREHYLTAPVLAERMNVSVRTIRRDISELSAAYGHHIYEDRGYKILNGKWSLKPQLTFDDYQTFQELISSSPLSNAPEFKQRCQRFQTKLLSLIPDSNPLEAPILSADPPLWEQLTFSFEELERACREDRLCQIDYQALNEKCPSTRLIQPYSIIIRNGSWYLIAIDLKQNDFRLYRLERFTRLTVLDETFTRKPDFDIQKFFEESWSVFQGERITVEMLVRGKAARLAAERNWPKEKNLEWLSDDEARLTVTVQSDREITLWVLSMGTEAEVLSPESLRESVYTILKETCAQYEKG